jgi:hypothetical protein
VLYRQQHEVPQEAIRQVHDAIVEHFKPPRMPGAQGMGFIKKRLFEEQITADDWCKAIRGYAREPYWNGTKPGEKSKLNFYDRFRDAKGFDVGLDLYRLQESPKAAAPEAKPPLTRVQYAPPAGVIPPVIEDVRAHLKLGPTRSPEEVRKILATIPRPSFETAGEKAVA